MKGDPLWDAENTIHDRDEEIAALKEELAVTVDVLKQVQAERAGLKDRAKELEADRFTCPNCKSTFGWNPSFRNELRVKELETLLEIADGANRAVVERMFELSALAAKYRKALENVLLAMDHEDYYNDEVFDAARDARKED